MSGLSLCPARSRANEDGVDSKRVEAQITDQTSKQEKKKIEIMQLQQQLQQAAQTQAEG